MTRFRRCGLSTILSFAFAAGLALAQPQGPPPGGMMGGLMAGMMGGGGDLQLVANPAVLKELNLTAKQKTQLRSVEEAGKASRQEMFAAIQENGVDPQAIGEQIASIRQDQDAKVGRILDKTQKTRLAQIKLQRDGITAVTRSEVASKLKITNPQSKQIKKIMESMNKEIASAMPTPPMGFNPPPGGFPGFGGNGGPPHGAGMIEEGNTNPTPKGNGKAGATTSKKKGGNRTTPPKADPANDPNGAGEAAGPAGERPRGGGPGPAGQQFEEFRAKMEQGFQTMRKSRESAAKQVEALLTDDQKAAWAKLIGEPFDVSSLTPAPGGPGGPGAPPEKGDMKKAKKDAADDQ